MDDEGYTSPVEELDVTNAKENTVPVSAEKQSCYNRFIESWESIRCPKNPNVRGRTFLTDNTTSADFADSFWRITTIQGDNGSHAVIKSSLRDPIYLTVSEFISHLLHLLNGRESISFWSCTEELYLFKRNPHIIVKGLSPTTLDNYSVKFIQCGGLCKKLLMITDEQFLKDSSIFATFQSALSDYLKIYQTLLMVKAESMTTFARLQQFIQPFHLQFQILEHIAEVAMHRSPISLILELNRMIFVQETPCIQDLLRSFFILSTSTYMRYISDWIFRGELASPMDFHIKSVAEVTVNDRRFWTRQFVQSENVPPFIQDLTDLIFETGKAIHLFNLIKNLDYSAPTSSLFSYDTNQILIPCESFDDLPRLTLEWNTKLRDFLTENNYLTQGITDSISHVLCKSFNTIEIDFSIIDSVRSSYTSKVTESKANNLMRKRSQQRRFRLSLQEQVDEAKLLKVSEKQRDLAQSQANVTYNARKEQEYDNERIKFREKYFPTGDTGSSAPARRPESLVEEVLVKMLRENVESSILEDPSSSSQIPAGSSEENVQGSRNISNPDVPSTLAVEAALLAEIIPDAGNPTQHEPKPTFPRDLDDVDSCGKSPKDNKIKSPGVTTRKRNYNKKICKTIEQILGFKQDSDIPEFGQLVLDQGEEKLDPEKFILTKSDPVHAFSLELLYEKPKAECYPPPRQYGTDSNKVPADASFLNLLFTQSVDIPLQAQHKMVNTALLYYFITEKQLYHHLFAMNEFLLLQNGVFGHSLTSLLIEERRKSPSKSLDEFRKNTASVQLVLNDALSIVYFNRDLDPLTQNLSFVLAHDDDMMMKELLEIEGKSSSNHISSEFRFLNALRLTYVIDWPLNIIITDDMIHHYESLFGIFMQLARSEQLLHEIFYVLKSKRSKSPQLVKLQFYRHKLLHFVRTLREYMNMEIVHTGWIDFCASLETLDSLENIYDHIVRYVRQISANCFLSFSVKGGGILKLIWRYLAIVDSFCSQILKICGNEEFNWDKGSEIKEHDYTLLRRKHAATWQYHKMFLTTLYKASGKDIFTKIDSFLEFHDFNNFYEEQLTTEKEFVSSTASNQTSASTATTPSDRITKA